MKIYTKILISLVILAVIAPFYLRDRGGMPLMSINNLKMPEFGTPDVDIPTIPESAQAIVENLTPDSAPATANSTEESSTTRVKLHKWRDENGVWHFTDINAPPKGRKSEVVMINADANTYTSSATGKVKEKVAETVDDIEKVQVSPLLPFTHGKETMEQAKQVQKLLEERHKLQQKAMQ